MAKHPGMVSPDIVAEEPRAAAIIKGLADLNADLLRPPSVALLGEVNVGKSSVANCLLGRTLLSTSIVDTTSKPIALRHAPNLQIAVVTKSGRYLVDRSEFEGIEYGDYESLEIGLPSERLKSFEIIDTPGQTGVHWLRASHTSSTSTHIAAWCTLATQAWKESERRAWAELPRELTRDGVLIVTNKDQLVSEEEASSLRRRLVAATRGQFRRIVFVSARPPSLEESLRPAAWLKKSGIAELETVLLSRSIKLHQRRLRAAMRTLEQLHRFMRRA